MSFLPAGNKIPIVLQPDEGKVLDVLGEKLTIKVADHRLNATGILPRKIEWTCVDSI